MMNVAVLLFEDFETLDVFGPVEILGRLKDDYQIHFYSEKGGLVKNSHGVSIETHQLSIPLYASEILLIPGGLGTRKEVYNQILIDLLSQASQKSTYTLTVCTGSALLAKTGLLDHREATSNKRAFDWVVSNRDEVHWIKKARWTVDGSFYTSSGVSAGMDMVLGFLMDRHGYEFAKSIAFQIEYNWQENKNFDDFCLE